MGEVCNFTVWSGLRGLFANFVQKVTKIEFGIVEKAGRGKIKN